MAPGAVEYRTEAEWMRRTRAEDMTAVDRIYEEERRTKLLPLEAIGRAQRGLTVGLLAGLAFLRQADEPGRRPR